MNRQDLGSDLMGGQDAGSVLHRFSHYSSRRGSPRVWRAVDAGDGPKHTSGPQAAISFLMAGGVRTAAWAPEGGGPGSVPEGGTAKCCWEEQCPRPGPVRGRGCDQGPHESSVPLYLFKVISTASSRAQGAGSSWDPPKGLCAAWLSRG